MNKFNWVVTTSAAMQSQAPPGFRPRLRTHDFILWHRDHPVGQRRTLFEPINPGAPLDCSDPGEAKLRKVDGTATVFTVQPVVGRVWHPSPELTQIEARPAAALPDARPLGHLDPVREHAGAARHRERGPAGRALRRHAPHQPALPRALAVLPGRHARGEAARERSSSTSASTTRRWSAACCTPRARPT